MMNFLGDPDKGPKSDWARYAYGYSDAKPGRGFWIVIALMILFIVGAHAEDAAKPVPANPPGSSTVTKAPPPPTTDLIVNGTDLQVLILAVANAGSACDDNLQPYCLIVGNRSGIQPKLTAAFQALQAKKP